MRSVGSRRNLGITTKPAQGLRIPDSMIDVHLHLPAGAQKKDVPRAGIAMVCSPFFLSEHGAKVTVGWLVQVCVIVSLLTGKCVPFTAAMPGEVHLKIVPLLPL